MNIDGSLEETPGVSQSDTSFAKQQTKITFDESKVSREKITEVVKGLGYEVESFAEAES